MVAHITIQFSFLSLRSLAVATVARVFPRLALSGIGD